MPHEIDETDLEHLISGKRHRKLDPKWKPVLKYIGAFICLSIFFYLVLNLRGISSNISYWYQNQFGKQTDVSHQTTIMTDSTKRSQPTVALPSMDNDTIYIPAINVTAPISWHIPNETNALTIGLEKGVIQLEGTALPGQVGNIFITGHSSNFLWAKGDYNQIFALLHNLVVGDKVYLKYGGTTYQYEVKNEKIVKPDDLSVLEQTKTSVLTLMTCTPVGTNYRRLIVTTVQTYPDPSKNADFNGGANTSTLPRAR